MTGPPVFALVVEADPERTPAPSRFLIFGHPASIAGGVQLIPKLMVVGVYMAPTASMPGVGPGGTPAADRFTRIWAEVGPRFGYRRFELSPDNTGVQIEGPTDHDAIVIQPPLVQVRGSVPTTVALSADNSYSIFKVVAEQLGIHQFFNLGVRLVYHAPAPQHDGRSFVMNKLFMRSDSDFAAVERGGTLWAGAKFVVDEGSANHTLLIEPLLADNEFLFIDLDTSFPGEIELDAVKLRAQDAERYVTGAVADYLDGLV